MRTRKDAHGTRNSAYDDEADRDVRGEIDLKGENVYKEAGVFGTFL